MPSAGEQLNDGNYIIKCDVSAVGWLQRVSGRLIEYSQHANVETTWFSKEPSGEESESDPVICARGA